MQPVVSTAYDGPWLRGAGGGTSRAAYQSGVKIMLETLAIVLILLWLLGLVSSYTIGGFIHILLVIAVIVILLRVVQGRRL
jgi:hypothetical protein